MIRTRPASSWSGLSTGMAAIVVQFGLAMIPFGVLRATWPLTSATIERNVGIHPERRGVVDDDRSGGGEFRGVSSRRGGAGGEQGDVEPGRVGRFGIFDDDVGALPRQRGSGRARGREVAHLGDGEIAFVEQAAHDAADLAGGADDTDADTGECCRHGRNDNALVGDAR